MSAPAQEAKTGAVPAMTHAIQMTMTDQEFGIIALGLSLVLSVRSNDKGGILHGMTLIVRMDDEMLEALDGLAEKIDAGWKNIKVVET